MLISAVWWSRPPCGGHSQAFAKKTDYGRNLGSRTSESGRQRNVLGRSFTRGLKSASGGLSHGFFVHCPNCFIQYFCLTNLCILAYSIFASAKSPCISLVVSVLLRSSVSFFGCCRIFGHPYDGHLLGIVRMFPAFCWYARESS